jgi:hypothetical protein
VRPARWRKWGPLFRRPSSQLLLCLLLDLLQGSRDFLAQIDYVEWFSDEIEGSGVQSFVGKLLRVHPCEHDDFTGRLDFLDAAQSFNAIGFRHQHVEKDYIRFGIQHYRYCRPYRIRFHQTKIFGKNHLERFTHPKFIVNNQQKR